MFAVSTLLLEIRIHLNGISFEGFGSQTWLLHHINFHGIIVVGLLT